MILLICSMRSRLFARNVLSINFSFKKTSFLLRCAEQLLYSELNLYDILRKTIIMSSCWISNNLLCKNYNLVLSHLYIVKKRNLYCLDKKRRDALLTSPVINIYFGIICAFSVARLVCRADIQYCKYLVPYHTEVL